MILLSKCTVVAFLVVATTIVATPARAMDSGEAAKLCADRGPDCVVGMDKDGNSEFCVKNTNGVECVTCPRPPGNCTVALKGNTGPGQTRLPVNVFRVPPIRSPGLLDSSPGFSPQGPSGTGTPGTPSGGGGVLR